MFTLSFIINSNIGAETKKLTHEDVCALARRQLYYFLNVLIKLINAIKALVDMVKLACNTIQENTTMHKL